MLGLKHALGEQLQKNDAFWVDISGCTLDKRGASAVRALLEFRAEGFFGGVSRVAKGGDCKSPGVRLRRFESYFPHHASELLGAITAGVAQW